MPTVTYEIPYENAKEMLLVEEVDNKDFLTGLFDVMYDEPVSYTHLNYESGSCLYL